jgi:hypothetical protein
MTCALSWEKLVEMKDGQTEFWTLDGNSRLRIVEVNRKPKSVYFICVQTGKITWPLKYEKLKEVHEKIEKGELGLVAHEIDRLVPTWGNYITGLLTFLGCHEPVPVVPPPKGKKRKG